MGPVAQVKTRPDLSASFSQHPTRIVNTVTSNCTEIMAVIQQHACDARPTLSAFVTWTHLVKFHFVMNTSPGHFAHPCSH